jgi:hypothetical protein
MNLRKLIGEEIEQLNRVLAILLDDPGPAAGTVVTATRGKATNRKSRRPSAPRAPGARGPGRPPKSDGPSLPSRLLGRLAEGPDTSAALAVSLSADPKKVSGALSQLKRAEKVKSDGEKPNVIWSLP